jgi:hypothetical protein
MKPGCAVGGVDSMTLDPILFQKVSKLCQFDMPTKGQSISKGLSAILEFFQKPN